MSSKFKNLSKLDVTINSRYSKKVDVPGQEEPMILLLAPALGCNKPYTSAKLKQMAKNQKANKDKELEDIDTTLMDAIQKQNRIIAGEFIIVGWENMPGDGEFVEFNAENAAEFALECPDWLFLDLLEDAANKDNFIAEAHRLSKANKEALLKN